MAYKSSQETRATIDPCINNKAENILTIRDLEFGYKPHNPVLKGINLDVPKGRFFGLLGPSGSGKSTLLKLIIGLLRPWYGYVEFGTGDCKYTKKINDTFASVISSLFNPIKNSIITSHFSIGYVPQIESVDWNFPVTVNEVVGMGIWKRSGIYPWFNKNSKEKVQHILGSFGISEHAKRQIRELSGGEQQRVFLARALISNPQILILDEPTSGVDYSTREKIFGILTDLNLKGMTIIISTHDIMGLGKRLPWVVCINKSIISQGPPNEALTSDTLLRTYGLAIDVNSIAVDKESLSVPLVEDHNDGSYANNSPR